MVVQHLESRLALSSVNPSEQLHEFQIVHALITQCWKQATNDETPRNDNNNHSSPEHQMPALRRKSSKEERSSFVTTIRQTFNALTQATNHSLCAKQNATSHPPSIASTVKNIISQFSRQNVTPCLVSPSQGLTSKASCPHLTVSKRPVESQKATNSDKDTRPAQSCLSEPSTSRGSSSDSKSRSHLKPSPPNTIATKPKTRSVRAKNAHRLTRHESAPIHTQDTELTIPKKTVSVRRSKSDAVCYTSFMKQTRRKIDSNVQTKVLHFENCCKGKGQGAMCLECRKHNFEDGITSPPHSLSLPKIDSVRPKQENYLGALSYHRPSTITQTQNAVSENENTSVASLPSINPLKTVEKKGPPQIAARPKAVPCPGGTFFMSDVPQCSGPTPKTYANDPSPIRDDSLHKTVETVESEICQNLATMDESTDDRQCSQNKRKHSISDDEPMQSKRESRDGAMGNSIDNSTKTDNEISVPSSAMPENVGNQAFATDEDMPKTNDGAIKDPEVCQSSQNGNLYTLLCDAENSCLGAAGIETDALSDHKRVDNDLQLSLNYDSDNIDSSSSSGESCLSPRQEYLARQSKKSSLRRTPSTRYQKMRRKLKKLITRSRSCPEVPQPIIQSQNEAERYFLESIRIPAPTFMFSKDSFAVKRQQLSMHLNKNRDWMSHLPDHVLVQIFSYMDTRSLAMLKCVCKDFQFIIDSYDIRATDSLWVRDKRYLEDPCRFCRKIFLPGDMSMCRYHAKSYHCDLPYGRSYWMCCFKIERNAPGCRTGIHDNRWCPSPSPNK